MSQDFLKQQAKLWDEKVGQHGANYKGAAYRHSDRQILCFDQLTKICSETDNISLLDYGCGYGALLDYLIGRGFALSKYIGFDVSETMLDNAKKMHPSPAQHIVFTDQPEQLIPSDYVICSSVFNNKLDADRDDWQTYILNTLDRLWKLAKKGMSFNVLTNYADKEKMRPDLYYADPCFFFDYCTRKYSRNVALLHDYGIYEFTLLVRKGDVGPFETYPMRGPR